MLCAKKMHRERRGATGVEDGEDIGDRRRRALGHSQHNKFSCVGRAPPPLPPISSLHAPVDASTVFHHPIGRRHHADKPSSRYIEKESETKVDGWMEFET